jgi:hypothetical protein
MRLPKMKLSSLTTVEQIAGRECNTVPCHRSFHDLARKLLFLY